MSSGQAAWHDEQVSSAHEAHKNRLEQKGYYAIANIVDDIAAQLRYFEGDSPSLPRASWQRLDLIKEKLRSLA